MSISKNILRFLLYPLVYRIVKMPGKSYQGNVPLLGHGQDYLRARLNEHVEALAVGIGDRSIANYAGMLQAVEYIEREFRGLNLKVERQDIVFDGKVMPNLIVEIKGKTRPDEILVVGAHYDTVPATPGADDNASGVASMLELARAFARRDNDRTIRFVAFANEEHPGGNWDTFRGDGWMQDRGFRVMRAAHAGFVALTKAPLLSPERLLASLKAKLPTVKAKPQSKPQLTQVAGGKDSASDGAPKPETEPQSVSPSTGPTLRTD